MAVAVPLVFGVGGQLLGGYVAGSMGAIVGGMAGAYLGSLMFPPETEKTAIPKVDSYPVQTTLSGSVIPVVRGTNRVAGTPIYLGELHPYVVTSSSGGGGKGFGSGNEVTTSQTRYKRSFLIAICEGPATIGKAWKGDQPILTTDFTTFEGDGNVGLATTVGEEFAHWKPLCCAWFEEYDLGTTTSLPTFTFEVGSDTSFRICDLIVGGSYSASSDSRAEMTNVSGNFSHVMIAGSGNQVVRIIRHSDKDYVFAVSASVQKTKEDGTIVWGTSWGNMTRVWSILEGTDGYIYACGKGTYPSYSDRLAKLDPENGDVIWSALSGRTNSCWDMIASGINNIYVLDVANLAESVRYIRRIACSDGSILWNSAPTNYYEGRIALDEYNFLFSTGLSGTTVRIACIPTDDSGFEGEVNVVYHGFAGYQFYGGLVVKSGISVQTYVYIGISKVYQGAGDGVVVQMALTGPTTNPSPPPDYLDPSFAIEDTYNVGGRIYDIVEDIDGALLVLHDRGTGENGEIGHITKLGLDLSYLGIVDLDNDREGFPQTMVKGSGTIIGDNVDVTTVNPISVMLDILLDTRYGSGISSSLIDFDTYQEVYNHCKDEEIGIAVVLGSQRPMLDWMDFIQSHYFGFTRLG